MALISMEFGYYPRELDVVGGSLTIETLPNLKDTVADVESEGTVHEGWVYAPPQLSRDFFKGITYQRPYASRIFGLPKTHILRHANASGADHLNFLIWCLGFFAGMRLTSMTADS
jgi:hypothetical protein